VWKKVKIIGISIGIIAISIVAFIFGSRANGAGVQPDNGSSDRIRSGIDRSEELNAEIGESISHISDGLEQSRETAGRVNSRIGTAQVKLRSAIEILRTAKEKNQSDLVR